eukprot:CAMPEP_0167781608 /NCGR_PEP_ID=MMETSP0111_2-20121227/6030_1 /TAXON_ID=91324 /ORGANISM="Lotharella globosa, Strain CCCM811" /LENGTH=335 /DNA_ID=CAMNT_0007672295 /DNA_START=15 /DNA_END=1022 /DNA_ORIENTATION=-
MRSTPLLPASRPALRLPLRLAAIVSGAALIIAGVILSQSGSTNSLGWGAPTRDADSAADAVAQMLGGMMRPTESCLDSLQKHYPNAMSGKAMAKGVFDTFKKWGFSKKGSLLGVSTCPDEINRLMDKLEHNYGDAFPLSGLAGVPFTGLTGFKAFTHHVPDNGCIVIFFAPHVGISSSGVMGKMRRPGMKDDSGACGSLLAALAAVKHRKENGIERRVVTKNDDDYQQMEVEKIIETNYHKIANSAEPLVAALEVLYEEIKNRVLRMIPASCDRPIALVGGIQVNTDRYDHPSGNDFFVPKDVLLKKKGENNFENQMEPFKQAASWAAYTGLCYM